VKQGTKQRVVGTVVLLALALIFLPIVFDGEGSYQRTLSSRIPDPPVMRVMPDPIPERPVIQADVAATVVAQPGIRNTDIDTQADLDATAASSTSVLATNLPPGVELPTTVTRPSLDGNGLPVGWSVRLGSFSNTNNARNLTQRLLADGYRAYSREIRSAQGVLTAVFVGPQVERDKAEQLKQQLQTEFQLSGIVVKFEVDSI
jgi:DedD protein